MTSEEEDFLQQDTWLVWCVFSYVSFISLVPLVNWSGLMISQPVRIPTTWQPEEARAHTPYNPIGRTFYCQVELRGASAPHCAKTQLPPPQVSELCDSRWNPLSLLRRWRVWRDPAPTLNTSSGGRSSTRRSRRHCRSWRIISWVRMQRERSVRSGSEAAFWTDSTIIIIIIVT